jgi:DNA-binding response OmpR family regulator
LDVVEMGFEDYVVKPVERSELLETVDQLLCLDRCDRQLRRFYALTAKRASLRTAKPDRELRRSDEYATLTREWRRLRSELDESFEELPDQALLTLVDERLTDDGVEPSVTSP